MIISHTHKFIFIKSEKTAGTSIEAILSTFCGGDDVVVPINDFRHNRTESGEFIHRAMNADEEYRQIGQHVDAETIRRKESADVWNRYFKFSIVRNPWDRTLSDFYWKRRQDPALQPRKRFYHRLGVPFDEIGHLQKPLTDFLNSEDYVNNDRFYVIDDELCVDFVIRYEHLEEDLLELGARLELPPIELPRLKTGFRQKKHHYSEYFNDSNRQRVAAKHRNDIRFFGYSFESP